MIRKMRPSARLMVVCSLASRIVVVVIVSSPSSRLGLYRVPALHAAPEPCGVDRGTEQGRGAYQFFSRRPSEAAYFTPSGVKLSHVTSSSASV